MGSALLGAADGISALGGRGENSVAAIDKFEKAAEKGSGYASSLGFFFFFPRLGFFFLSLFGVTSLAVMAVIVMQEVEVGEDAEAPLTLESPFAPAT